MCINTLGVAISLSQAEANGRVTPFQSLPHAPFYALHELFAAGLRVFVTAHAIDGIAVRLDLQIVVWVFLALAEALERSIHVIRVGRPIRHDLPLNCCKCCLHLLRT